MEDQNRGIRRLQNRIYTLEEERPDLYANTDCLLIFSESIVRTSLIERAYR